VQWFDTHFAGFVALAKILVKPLQKSSWQSLSNGESYALVRLIWCIKYAVGMGFLLLIGANWPAYKTGFVVADKDDPLRELYSITNGGWVMIAYCFATTQTAEGSVKKGLLRMIGTVLGSFTGWLSTIACEDDSFASGLNTYGIVAWLTITSALATFSATDRGFLARVSLASDYSFGPIYFVITQVIIVLSVRGFGVDSRNAITVNRMVANLVGILMAAILAVIPPGNYGGDPGHTKKVNDFHWRTLKSVIERICSSEGISDADAKTLAKEFHSLATGSVATSASLLELVTDFRDDADRLHKSPLFRVDPMLKMQIGLVTTDSIVLSFVSRLTATILDCDTSKSLLVETDGVVQNKMKDILDDMNSGGISGPGLENQVEFQLAACRDDILSSKKKSDSLPVCELADARDDIDHLIRAVGWLVTEIRSHEQALNNIEWGVLPGRRTGPIKK